MLLMCFTGFAQQDTLKNLVRAKGPEKLALLENWCNQELFFNKPLRKVELLGQLEQIAIKERDEIAQAYVIFYRGLYVMAMDRHRPNDAIVLMRKAIAMSERKKQHLQTAYFKHTLGYYYFTRAKNSVGSSRVDLQACKLEYSIVSPK